MSISELYSLFLQCDGVSTDSRKIRPDSLFVALKGENFDGNAYAKQALENGAQFALVSNPSLVGDKFIFVEDTLKALQELALHHRRQFGTLIVVGITGTNGKTTTKELAATALLLKYRIVKTEGNLNNHIGVPLTLLRIKKITDIAIIEMGANTINDIRDLCAIAEPTHGIITNIGSAHLEGFGSKEGVARAKGALYEWLRDHSGTIFVNKHDADLTKLLYSIDPHCKAQTIRYGDEEVPDNKHLFGLFNKENMKAAIAIGRYFKVGMTMILKALKHYEPNNMRGQMITTPKGNDIILDAYNANPSSMHAAIESFALMHADKPKWLILGDMKELGAASDEEHANVLRDLSFYCFTNVVLIGESFFGAHGDMKRYATFRTKEEFLASPFVTSIRMSSVLIKGSNSMKMWEIANHL